jgi:hypothetical protein
MFGLGIYFRISFLTFKNRVKIKEILMLKIHILDSNSTRFCIF